MGVGSTSILTVAWICSFSS